MIVTTEENWALTFSKFVFDNVLLVIYSIPLSSKGVIFDNDKPTPDLTHSELPNSGITYTGYNVPLRIFQCYKRFPFDFFLAQTTPSIFFNNRMDVTKTGSPRQSGPTFGVLGYCFDTLKSFCYF